VGPASFLVIHWIRVDQMALAKVAISDWTSFARASNNLDRMIKAVDQLSIIVSPSLTA